MSVSLLSRRVLVPLCFGVATTIITTPVVVAYNAYNRVGDAYNDDVEDMMAAADETSSPASTTSLGTKKGETPDHARDRVWMATRMCSLMYPSILEYRALPADGGHPKDHEAFTESALQILGEDKVIHPNNLSEKDCTQLFDEVEVVSGTRWRPSCGCIVAIVFGCLAGVAVIVVVSVWLILRSRKED